MRDNHQTTRGTFQREWLPDPVAYYSAQGLTLKGARDWRLALCPFHDDTVPSLSVSVASGGYRCFACGARGRDVLAFHRQRTGSGFVEAARALGAWREGER